MRDQRHHLIINAESMANSCRRWSSAYSPGSLVAGNGRRNAITHGMMAFSNTSSGSGCAPSGLFGTAARDRALGEPVIYFRRSVTHTARAAS